MGRIRRTELIVTDISSTCKTKLALFSVVLLLGGCYYDNEATLYANAVNCDITVNATFSNDVLPLMNGRCNNCHAGVSPSGGVKLDTYADAVKYVNNGSLIGSIQHTSGFPPMPKNGNKMSACQIQRIQNWIENGALNN